MSPEKDLDSVVQDGDGHSRHRDRDGVLVQEGGEGVPAVAGQCDGHQRLHAHHHRGHCSHD